MIELRLLNVFKQIFPDSAIDSGYWGDFSSGEHVATYRITVAGKLFLNINETQAIVLLEKLEF